MPRKPKGPRLHLRPARADRRTEAVYVIRDGRTEVSTGCGPNEFEGAQEALWQYLGAKRQPEPQHGRAQDPDHVLIADVIALYAREKAPSVADPVSCRGRLETLLEFWGEATVGDIKRSTCNDYVAWRVLQPNRSYKDTANAPRVSDQSARRELEDLSAAVFYWNGEFPLTRLPVFTLPDKDEGNRDALTRQQAARLLKAAMGYRFDKTTGKWTRLAPSSRKNRAHLRRFLLMGFYTGTRPGVLPKVRWEMSDDSAWVDLDAGIIYRRGRRERDHRNKRRPLVKIPGRLLAHLRRWRRMDRLLFSDGDAAAAGPGTVIHHGGRALAGRIRTGFEGIARDAGLDPETLTPHWMRHTCATWLMENDVPVWEAAGYLGMTVEMLERNYGHHRPNHHASARSAFTNNKDR